jgi:quercetin dioxygenase-like cupin family protein
MTPETAIRAHDIAGALEDLPIMEFHGFGDFSGGSVGVFRADAGISPWELHPHGEELLQVIEGAVEIELLTDAGAEIVALSAGMMLIVPRGVWHRHRVADHLAELYATAGSTEHSFADDPRV